ncbi:MAG: addiction module protein [Pyrinomonadaceae bacterium]
MASICDSIYSKTIIRVLLDEILELPVAERIKLVEDIWDSIAVIPEDVQLTSEQMAEIERRIEDYRKNPDDVVPWGEIRERFGFRALRA